MKSDLNYKMLSIKTLVDRTEAAAPGYTRSIERLTILPCFNARGNHKMDLGMIGKHKHPRVFKAFKKIAFHV